MGLPTTQSFIEYLTSLAPEGETMLFVKQKQKHNLDSNGDPQYYWKPFRPKDFRAGGSDFVNTASFDEDLIGASLKLSASSVYCERVAFMMLDDIGTKSKVPPLAPTWIIETSEGNFQWGYVFKEFDMPLKGIFTAAIKSIADAGYTDGGAINAVRNVRIPGSVNLKPGRDNFEARLIEFNAEREFTVEEICAALDVVPDDPVTSNLKMLGLFDENAEEVLSWLVAKGDILEPRNGEGWYGVICPNHAMHSDGNLQARYNPQNRSFSCFHEHCQHLDSRGFLEWVAGHEGAPECEHGFNENQLAGVMAKALASIKPSTFFSSDAATVIQGVELRELGRLSFANLFTQFAYIQSDDCYFDLWSRREVTRKAFNALYRHLDCRSINGGRKIEAGIAFDEYRQEKGAQAVVGLTYAAGDPTLAIREGDLYGNRWRDSRPKHLKEGDVSLWLAHCKTLVPDDQEREHIFNVMAFKVQHPDRKINHAILHGGSQGSGKDTMYHPFFWAVCGAGLKNIGIVENDGLASAFGYALESEILVINELRESEARDRRMLANKLKPLIAAPPEVLTVNRKNLHPYDMVNRLLVMAFSNDPVPIQLESQDRRWFCVWSHAPLMEVAKAKEIWTYYANGGCENIAYWLHARDVSMFNPAETPMTTDYKLTLIEQGMSVGESFLVDLLRERRGEFSKGIVASPFHKLLDRLDSSAPGGFKIPQAAFIHALREAGWIDKGRLKSSEFASAKQIYIAPNDTALENMSKSDLRRAVEPEYGKLMSLVK